MDFYPGFSITPQRSPMGFSLGEDCFDCGIEFRTLDSLRKSLRDPNSSGPDPVYAIMMDVGKKVHRSDLEKRMLLYGVVTYAAGRLGNEPIRSQGHVHAVSPHCGWSTPEVYEIWEGKAVIYMQQTDKDDPGACYAVYANPGDVVIVPPFWAHATISADPSVPLTFGAWCDREYGFEYSGVRKHAGIAWFPIIDKKNSIVWKHNNRYVKSENLIRKSPETYEEFGIQKNKPIYSQYETDPDRFMFVSNPASAEEKWKKFIP